VFEHDRLTIKGRPTDPAVLCTSSKTYSLRTVQISNELVLLRRPSSPLLSSSNDSSSSSSVSNDADGHEVVTAGDPNRLNYVETLHELMEMSVCVPRLDRIEDVLEGQRWGGLDEDGEDYEREEDRGVS
jgi:sister chromatid cohesion protein DCC1